MERSDGPAAIMMSSVHLMRKPVLAGNRSIKANRTNNNGTESLEDLLMNEDYSDDSDNEVPDLKSQYFEFTDGYNIMRLIRLLMVVQIIAIVIDDPGIHLAVLFNICCRGILLYSLKFFSRPFIDTVYIVQYFWNAMKKTALHQHTPAVPKQIVITGIPNRRSLTAGASSEASMSWSLNVIDPQAWHALKCYTDYFAVILFAVMSILFLLRYWEIQDYSNREEVKQWLKKHIADGWWRRGGINIPLSMLKGCFVLGIFVFLLYSMRHSFSNDSIPSGLYLSTITCIIGAILAITWFLGYTFLKTTEHFFLRYVSQNVAYTSAIVLKRILKSKIEVGLVLIIALFMPLLYILMQSLLFFVDWNVAKVLPYRKSTNFNIPCYFMAFPPYRIAHIDRSTCPVASLSSSHQIQPHSGFFHVHNILSCDSYWGIMIYWTSFVVFVVSILGYFLMIYTLITLVIKEFVGSRWMDIVSKLEKIHDEEIFDYRVRTI